MDLSNKTVNLLNLHSGLQHFSSNIYDVFGAVYLLTQGLSFTVVSLAFAGGCLLRNLFRIFSLFLSEKIGLKRALIFGTILNSGLFLIISKVNGINSWLYFYIFYSVLCDITYWLPYHTYYSVAGDDEKRGKQIGAKLSLISLFKISAPLVGGIIITHLGFFALSITSILVSLLSIIPLLFTKDIIPNKSIDWKGALKIVGKKGFIMRMGDGILYIHTFIWTIVIFYIARNYVVFGGLVTFELFSTTLLFLLLGYFIDKGKGKIITYIGLISTGIVILLRALWITTIPGIILSDIVLAFGMAFYSSSFEVGFYNLAKQSTNALWFQFFSELGWDIGAMVCLALSAFLYAIGIPLQFILIISVAGLFINYGVLKKFYSQSTRLF